MKNKIKYWAVTLLIVVLTFTSCDTEKKKDTNSLIDNDNKKTLRIVSGSENKELTPIFEKFVKEKGINLDIQYKGSVDIMRILSSDNIEYDAVWPASSLWISLGDKNHKVKDLVSTSQTPVVFGIKKSLAESLNLNRADVKVSDILAAIENGKLKFSMTSATQSNSGASAYLAFLNALAGSPDLLTMDHLNSPDVQGKITKLLGGVERSSGSSEWLKTLFLQGDFDAMVNYESLILTTNEELVKQGKEPLYVIYPVDGVAIADSPLGYIAGKDPSKEEIFREFQNYLMEENIQKEIQKYGRRTGIKGIAEENKPLFKKEWGLDPDKVLSPKKIPNAEVIFAALDYYQTSFRKPSINVYCLDYSGSMNGSGNKSLVEAMKQLLIQENAKKNLLQASQKEENIVIFFSDRIISVAKATGNGADLESLFTRVRDQNPGGGTEIYGAAIEALNQLKGYDLKNYSPAIILMTDGKHNGSKSIKDLENTYKELSNVPIFSILFGDAKESELEEIAKLAKGRVFDGRKNLIDAFRNVKGYN